jgi:hypothetical protein
MAVGAESYEILFFVVALPATRLEMMNFQIGPTPAILTTPAIPLQDFPAQSLVPFPLQPDTRSLPGRKSHEAVLT